jgi:hypothetical protein
MLSIGMLKYKHIFTSFLLFVLCVLGIGGVIHAIFEVVPLNPKKRVYLATLKNTSEL